MASRGRLIIVSGPSGAGKSTVLRELLRTCDLPLILSISATTRPPRPGEQNGREYHFVDHTTFQAMRESERFLEYKEVFGRGDWYGTIRSEVEKGLEQGKWVILEIDVQGAMAVQQQMPGAISFFVHPGSLKELETRLRRRGTDSEMAISRRLEVAADEMKAIPRYHHEIINVQFEDTVKLICNKLHQYVSPER